MKTFKDYVPEEKVEPTLIEPKVVKPKLPKVTKPPVSESVKPKEKSFVSEVMNSEVRKEVYETEKSLLESRLKEDLSRQIKEEYDIKLMETKVELYETMVGQMSKLMEESTEKQLAIMESLIKSNELLFEKISELQTSLNITVPTPIVQFTMPERNVVRQIHRDSKGNITHITESSSDDAE